MRTLGLGLAVLLAGCSESPGEVVPPRFAQVGELRVDVEVPLAGGEGRLEGTLVWQSDGRWILAERIYFRGVQGEEVLRRSRLNPGDLAPEYRSLIEQLNESPGLRLPGEIAQGGPVTCASGQSRVIFTMVDTFRDEVAVWNRCATGSIFTITPGSAGPDAGAARVVTAAQLTRSFTLGDGERSVFEGSLPFASMDRGNDSPAREAGPLVFATPDGSVPEGWADFWIRHAGEGVPLPEVDWSSEMVLFVTGGRRTEAGHAVAVRRVLAVGASTQIQAVESIPGDFCTPAALVKYPFHLVRAPLGPLPVSFADLLPQRVPCGG